MQKYILHSFCLKYFSILCEVLLWFYDFYILHCILFSIFYTIEIVDCPILSASPHILEYNIAVWSIKNNASVSLFTPIAKVFNETSNVGYVCYTFQKYKQFFFVVIRLYIKHKFFSIKCKLKIYTTTTPVRLASITYSELFTFL